MSLAGATTHTDSMKTLGLWQRACGLALVAISMAAGRNVQAETTVSIAVSGFPARTMEPCQVCAMIPMPVEVTLTRTGDLTKGLEVALQTGGTATAGVDYAGIPGVVAIPAGRESVKLLLSALDDALVEGPEIAEISIRPRTAYSIVGRGSVMAVISDDEPNAPSERLDLVSPANAAVFEAGVPSIPLRALGVSSTREIGGPVEFLADGAVIGVSNPVTVALAPVPYTPREHTVVWEKPVNGIHVLTARTPASPGPWLESRPVTIRVGPEAPVGQLALVATQRIAEEDSAPTMRPSRFNGEFTISRTGSTVNAQPFYLAVSGTAISGRDYKALPFSLSIPAGAASITVPVEAIPDEISEPLETVVAELSHCPPEPLLPPCIDFAIDPAHSRDTVFIRDDGITTATLRLTKPDAGLHFEVGQTIGLEALAIDVNGAITAVDFFDGDKKIGSSQLAFLVAPPPGTPIVHSFQWTGATAGEHALTAHAVNAGGAEIVSPPVTVTVGGNVRPLVTITAPANGAVFEPGSPIEITAAAIDSDGYTSTAFFYADGRKIGEVRLNFLVAPPAGETQHYSFTWREAAPGGHVLNVRVLDDRGLAGESAPVPISVGGDSPLPVVTVTAADAFSREPGEGMPAVVGAVNTAAFRLRRYGSTSGELSVNYAVGGRAINGTDYQRLTGTAVFPAGAMTTDVMVDPLYDTLVEERETVVFELQTQFDDGPERYRLGAQRRAVAVIVDRTWAEHPVDGTRCDAVGDGLFHLCAPSIVAPQGYRIEVTADFQHWETVTDGVPNEDGIQFVDPDAVGAPVRFYRTVDDPAVSGP